MFGCAFQNPSRWCRVMGVVVALLATIAYSPLPRSVDASERQGVISAVRPGESRLNTIRQWRTTGAYQQAIARLKSLAASKRVADDVKAQIPLERALIWKQWAEHSSNRKLQKQRLDKALASLQKFLKAHPDHSRTAEAYQCRGTTLLANARLGIDHAPQPKQRQKARRLTAESRTAFQRAAKLFEAKFKTFPAYIPPEKTELRRARREVEVQFMRAQLDVCSTWYWEAHTYPKGSDKRGKLLATAAREYGKMHQRYRTQVAGLYARLWQAKCLEEQKEIGRALGIYNELLSHPGANNSRALKNLQDQALYFKLICLNHPNRRDHFLAERFAQDWLKKNEVLHATHTGLGIRYELARAQKGIANKPNTPVKDRANYVNRALKNARYVARFPGRLRHPALLMATRLQVASGQGKKVKPPDDFEEAYGRAQIVFATSRQIRRELDAAKRMDKPEQVEKLTKRYQGRLKTAAEAFRLAIKLEKPTDELTQRMRARYLLAYLEYVREKNSAAYELAIEVARTLRKVKQETARARDAAYLALAAAIRLYEEAKNEGKAEAEKRVLDTAQFLIKHWPNSQRAKQAKAHLHKFREMNEKPQ